MAELWITKEAVRKATGWSERTIRWKVQTGALRSRDSSDRQDATSRAREYTLSSLPVDAQLKFLKQPLLSGSACTALAVRPDPNQSRLFAALPEVTEAEQKPDPRLSAANVTLLHPVQQANSSS